MTARLRLGLDRALRYGSVVFALYAAVRFAPAAVQHMGVAGTLSFLGLCGITYLLSQQLVPLMVMTKILRRTGDPGSFVLDAAVYAFVFAFFGWGQAAVLHMVTTTSLHNLRMRYTPLERLLRAIPGVPFWYLFGFVREAFHGSYLAYSIEGLAAFVVLLLAAHSAYIFLWFDVFFSLRTGQRIALLWRTQAADWATWALAAAQSLWGYAALQIYLQHREVLAVASFLPLLGFAFLLRREHDRSVQMFRMSSSAAAMDAVLRKEDPLPFLQELLESVRSPLFGESLALFMRSAGTVGYEAIAQTGDLSMTQEDASAIQLALWRLANEPDSTPEIAPRDDWAVYPIRAGHQYYGGLVVYRARSVGDPIERGELHSLARIVAPVMHNLVGIQAAQYAADVDSLTGLLNRAGLGVRLSRLFAGPKLPRCVAIMLDIDHFKHINDSLGHAQGDVVLRIAATVMRESCRDKDVLARYGGEEFLMLLLDVDVTDAERIIDRIRAGIAERVNVTMSAGITAYLPPETPESMIERADAALYAAKNTGRNRFVTI